MEKQTGVPAPNYTQMPNALLALMPYMGDCELRVTFAIARKTFGWHKKRDRISLTQLEEATGLSRQGVINGIEQGLERGTVERFPEGRQGFSYSILVNDADQSETSQPSRPELVNDVDQLAPELVNHVDTQKKDLKKPLKKWESEAKPASPPPTPEPSNKPRRERKPKPTTPPSPDKEGPSKDLYAVSRAVLAVCHLDAAIYGKRIFADAKKLCDAALPATADLITEKYGPGGWWYREDWRGKKGEFPTPDAMFKTWGLWTAPKVIPITAAREKTNGQLIREMLNGDTTDDSSIIDAVFKRVPDQERGTRPVEAAPRSLAASARGRS